MKHPLPDVLESHLDASGTRCVFDGLSIRIVEELTSESLDVDCMRLFRVGVLFTAAETNDSERNRLLYVGEADCLGRANEWAEALERANARESGADVLPQIIEHIRIGGTSLVLTSDHLGQSLPMSSRQQWWDLELATATEMLISVTNATRCLHELGLALGGIGLGNLMFDISKESAVFAQPGKLLNLQGLSEEDDLHARQRDFADIGTLLLEASTSRAAKESEEVFRKVLDDAQLLVDANLAKPGLSQLLVGTLKSEVPFGYTNAEDLLLGMIQLRIELQPSLSFRTLMHSSVGNFPLRRTDQDSCGYTETRVVFHGTTQHLGFYCVADGVGGEEHGERASQACVSASIQAFHRAINHYRYEVLKANTSNIARSMVKIAAQHLAIVGEAAPDTNKGATTFTGMVIAGDKVGLGHVGDSRAYLCRDGKLIQLTRDHNLANVKLALSRVTGVPPGESSGDDRRISRYLGATAETPFDWVDAFDPDLVSTLLETEESTQPEESKALLGAMLLDANGSHSVTNQTVHRRDTDHHALSATLTIKPGDRLLLMSDGLYGELDDDVMREVMLGAPEQDVAKALLNRSMVDLAMDNISILVVEVDESTPNTYG